MHDGGLKCNPLSQSQSASSYLAALAQLWRKHQAEARIWHAGEGVLKRGALHIVGALTKPQLQHLHVWLSGPHNVFSRRMLGELKQEHESRQRFKGKV